MHVIFTRSNYDKFNKLVFPIVEKQLEQYCDKHWSTMTDHSILFYSGAWKPMVNPTDVHVTAMREELKNLPTLLITPFFRPGDGKLVFQLHMWGVGANSTDKLDVPEIEPTEFQRSFNNQDDYDNEEGLLYEIVEDLVPYLECMIGYMADTYFWSSVGLAPHLPLLVTNGTINTDGMKYLVDYSREYYDRLLLESEGNAKQNPFMQQNLLNLFEGSAELWDEGTRKEKLEDIRKNYIVPEVSPNCKRNVCSIEDFDSSMYEEKEFETIDILQDVLVFLQQKMVNIDREEQLYLFLYRIGEGQIITNVIDGDNMVHLLTPSVSFKFSFDKLFKARKVKEFFKGKREKTIAVNDIDTAINRLRNLYKSPILTY